MIPNNYNGFLIYLTLIFQLIRAIASSNMSTCPTLISTSSTTVQCKLNNGNLPDCNNPVEGTIAILTCNPWFEHPSLDNNPTRLCKNGRWDLPIHQCYSTCGLKTSKGVANIINGTNVKAYGDYPWQIGVYKSKDKEFICGGSIIEPHAVLSAAHCFTDYSGNIQPMDDYIIAAGKYYRPFDDKRDQLAQYSRILKIYKPERFKAQYNLFTSDIVIIILKDSFSFSEVVQPVCINLKEERQQLLDSTGIVTGWGHTEEGRNLSEELKELIVPLVPFNQCFNQVSENYRKYITDDKICAGYKSKGTSICQGDSGGALVYRNAADGRYYVIGIVSTSPATNVLTCDSNEYGTYTSVSHHYQFVRNSLSQHQPYESIECTGAQCSYGYMENRINCNGFNNFCNATSKNCKIPPNPPYTQYKILGETETNYKPGDFADEFSVLEIMCHEGYSLSTLASNNSICLNGIWYQSPTACLDTCPSLMSTDTTVVKCSYNNKLLVNCTNPVHGTTALLSCNPMYEEPNIQRNPVRVCRKNRWNPPITQCYPVCGVKHPTGAAEIVSGREVTVEDYPWHIAIYSSATKEFQCSGSIIDRNIILTAAHCVTDYHGNVKSPDNYLVTAGKIHSKYDEIEDQSAQYANISAIHVQERFRGITYNFALDLAVLILSHPLVLTPAVQPVCIELNEESQHFHLSSNLNGVITKWNYTQENKLSDVLKELIIQLVPFNKCFNELPSDFKKFLAEDSICGGNINNETFVCSGDSGGGLFFKDVLSDRYFIKGISTISSLNKCDPNRYDLYTLVDHHINFVRNLVALNQFRTSLVCMNRDCTNEGNQTENYKETESENCETPPNPLYGKYKILGESEESYTPAKIAKEFSILEVRCHKGYAVKPIGPKIATCINGKWNQSPMACIRTCPSLISTESTTVKCSYNNVPLENCINPIKGTIAMLSCNTLYEEPNIERNPIRVCKERRWDSDITDCNPACGIKRPQGNALIVNGQDTTPGDYPWHTGIYRKSIMQLLCSGIIIEQNIILTAAHCVTDYVSGAINPVDDYLVAAGKYFSEYDDKKDQLAQYAKIAAIHVPERFKSNVNKFGLDIAILILEKPFKLTTAVQPVCIELNGKSEYINLSPSDRGVVTGWGFTEEGELVSKVLKEMVVPYVPFAKCFNELPPTFTKYLTQDKFCGGYLNNGTSICKGDSGGGLVFKNILRDRYFVKGIVSTSPATPEGTCDSNQYSTFTSVDHHIKFIGKHIALNQLRMPVECIGDDCTNEENQTEKNEEFNNSENCAIPYLLYTKYKILGESETSYKPGDFVKPGSILEISCRKGYALSPFSQNTSYCLNGKWNKSPAPCLSTCPSLITTETTRITCTYNNILLESCSNPVNGTKALLSCNPLYEEPTIQRNPIRLCKKNRWEPSASYCYPMCGISHSKENSDIVKAGNVDADFSWEVGIYNSTTKKFICSGTIIDLNIILTAAHCLTNDDGSILPADDYSVAAGKNFRQYYHARDLSVQYSNVLTIYVPEGYKGRSNMFASDIAILILTNPFMLYDGVGPVCVDLNEESRHLHLTPTNDEVTGWGSTQSAGEDLLREQLVSIIPLNQCGNESVENLRKYITPDKICGVYINNGTIECGDATGGGLVFQSPLTGRYFVKGILSTSGQQELATCNSNKYNLYTSVDHHINFMQDIVAHHQL